MSSRTLEAAHVDLPGKPRQMVEMRRRIELARRGEMHCGVMVVLQPHDPLRAGDRLDRGAPVLKENQLGRAEAVRPRSRDGRQRVEFLDSDADLFLFAAPVRTIACSVSFSRLWPGRQLIATGSDRSNTSVSSQNSGKPKRPSAATSVDLPAPLGPVKA